MDRGGLDSAGLIFLSLALAITVWAVFNTRGFFHFLSRGRKTEWTPVELAIIRVPGMIVIVAILWIFLGSLLVGR